MFSRIKGLRAILVLSVAVGAATFFGGPGVCPAAVQDPADRRPSRELRRADRQARRQIRRALADGQTALAESLLESRTDRHTRDNAPGWLLVEAELRAAQDRPAASGLLAMQIIILKPSADEVGPANFWAGRAFEALERPNKAAELYRACIAHGKTNNAIKQRAEARLAVLSRAEPDP